MQYIRTATLYHGNAQERYNLMRTVVPTLLEGLQHGQRLVLGVTNIYPFRTDVVPYVFDRSNAENYMHWLEGVEDVLLCSQPPVVHAEFICIVVEKQFDPLTFVPPDNLDASVVEVLSKLRESATKLIAA